MSPVAACQFAQAVPGSVETLPPDPKAPSLPQAMAEELSFPDRSNSALLLIDLEPKLALGTSSPTPSPVLPPPASARRCCSRRRIGRTGVPGAPTPYPDRPAKDWPAAAR
jgi:hypothetical protein